MAEETGQRGGMGEDWYDPAFLDRLRALFLRLRRRRRRRMRRAAPSAAHTQDFKDYRSYSGNDDFRSVDWRVYARLGRLFVRLFEEVEEYQVRILVDVSASMERPHGEKRRNALRLAVALGYLGLAGHHRVSVHALRDRVSTVLPPLKGPGNVHRIADELRKLRFGGVAQLPACCETFRPARQRYAVSFVLSDLLGHEAGAAEEALRRVGQWPGETHVIHILDPRELQPGLEGECLLQDVETGEERRMLLTARDRQRYAELWADYLAGVERVCASRQVDYQLWMTDRGFEEFFTALLDRGSVLGGQS